MPLKTFEQFISATLPTQPTQPSSDTNSFGKMVTNQLIRAKILPVSAIEQTPSPAANVRFLSDQIIEMHASMLNDSTTMTQRRQSYQTVCLSLMILTAIGGGIEIDPQD